MLKVWKALDKNDKPIISVLSSGVQQAREEVNRQLNHPSRWSDLQAGQRAGEVGASDEHSGW